MTKLNTPVRFSAETHEGAPAARTNVVQQLRRSVLACMLWENEFYEDGTSIADRITSLAESPAVHQETLAQLTIEARTSYKLRHVPLLLLAVLAIRAKGTPLVANTIEQTISRADELTEFFAVFAKYRGVGLDQLKTVITHGIEKGLGRAFRTFDAYQLAKYNRKGAIKLRDVLFLSHAKARTADEADLFNDVVNDKLPTPLTWETELSAGKDKKATFERLLREGKLGYLALLRNLRGMQQAGCDVDLIRQAIIARKGAYNVLPFRYVAAAKAAPQFEPYLDQALNDAIGEMSPLPGKTALLIDVSDSMNQRLSSKSDLTRMDAAATLGAIVPGDIRVFTFSSKIVEVPPRRGMAGVAAIKASQPHMSTHMGEAVDWVNKYHTDCDRLIAITDEQSHTRVPAPKASHAYVINVASYQNGVGYGNGWVHVDGFSEHVLRFIAEYERAGRDFETAAGYE